MKARSVILATLMGLLAPATTAWSAELRVPADYPSPQAAINAASNGDVVIVAEGTYGPINPFGRAITIRSESPHDPSATILDAGGGGPAVSVIFGETRRTIIEGFTITGGLGRDGGGVVIRGSDPVIRNCVIRNNFATGEGGGVSVIESAGAFVNCTFASNAAADGGAVAIDGGQRLTFDRCRFYGNSAMNDGGAIRATWSRTRFERCLLAGNTAGGVGGAYAGTRSTSGWASCLLRDNRANEGGAFHLDRDDTYLLNTTVVRNHALALDSSGAIHGHDAQPRIWNSIVRMNVPTTLAGNRLTPRIGYSNVDGGAPGPRVLDVDPRFVNAAASDFRLQADSPCENAGLNGWVPALVRVDLAGARRIRAGRVDMGAFEVQSDDAPKGVQPQLPVRAPRRTAAIAPATTDEDDDPSRPLERTKRAETEKDPSATPSPPEKQEDGSPEATPDDTDPTAVDAGPAPTPPTGPSAPTPKRSEHCTADADANGAVDVDDLLMVLIAWGDPDTGADLDGSTRVDFGDLLMVFTDWGGCPPAE